MVDLVVVLFCLLMVVAEEMSNGVVKDENIVHEYLSDSHFDTTRGLGSALRTR